MTDRKFELECRAKGCYRRNEFDLVVTAQKCGWSGISYDTIWGEGRKEAYCPDHDHHDPLSLDEVTDK